MNNFDDIEALWKAPQSLPLPDAKAIIKKASKEKNQVAGKILRQSLCMLLAIAAIIYVLYMVHFEYLITYIGLAIMSACVIVFAFIRLKQSLFLKRVDFAQSPTALLQQFEKFHEQQKWINIKGTRWYTLFLNLAFILYFYETVAIAPFTVAWKIVIIVIYIAWMGIATLWLGRRSVKKEHEKTRVIIEKIKELQQGLL